MKFDNSWEAILKFETSKKHFDTLKKSLDFEYQKHDCYPPKELIFRAFELCDWHNLKVVIIGQDPYHGQGEANGLSFSVNEGFKIPPSLRNIFKEINQNFDHVLLPTSGDLSAWASQGVLLLNASLSVEKNKPNSHKHLKWNDFTDAIINQISTQKKDIVFLLWGNFAQKKLRFIDANKHKILVSGHPSPMSANQGKWFGNRHFEQTNKFLNSIGKSEINWKI